eukprot:7595556-Alexandrium_andersonii.AAC.1
MAYNTHALQLAHWSNAIGSHRHAAATRRSLASAAATGTAGHATHAKRPLLLLLDAGPWDIHIGCGRKIQSPKKSLSCPIHALHQK